VLALRPSLKLALRTSFVPPVSLARRHQSSESAPALGGYAGSLRALKLDGSRLVLALFAAALSVLLG
jgi:hypothetical protein